MIKFVFNVVNLIYKSSTACRGLPSYSKQCSNQSVSNWFQPKSIWCAKYIFKYQTSIYLFLLHFIPTADHRNSLHLRSTQRRPSPIYLTPLLSNLRNALRSQSTERSPYPIYITEALPDNDKAIAHPQKPTSNQRVTSTESTLLQRDILNYRTTSATTSTTLSSFQSLSKSKMHLMKQQTNSCEALTRFLSGQTSEYILGS